MKELLALAAMAAASLGVCAEEFPAKNKPITLIVPFAAGGPTDRIARDLAETMRKSLGGATILVENTAGAGGSLGSAKAARASPDGYTLLVNHIAMATMPALVRNLSFKVDSDFEYLGIINDVPMTLIARPSMPATNYKELASWIGQNQGKISLGNAGVGSASHLCGLLLQSALKTEMISVPYKGTAPAIIDLVNGQTDLMCDQTVNTTSQIEARKVKAYAVTTAKRLPMLALKDLPTLHESGLKNFEITIWHGLYAPKGTSPAVLAKLNTALRAALQDPEFIKKEEASGAVVDTDKRIDPVEHKKFVLAEMAKWTPIIKATGVYAE